MNLIYSFLLLAISALFSSPPLEGHMYLDPGSGSFILQILIATLVGGMFVLKTSWQRIVNFFRSRTSKTEDDQEE